MRRTWISAALLAAVLWLGAGYAVAVPPYPPPQIEAKVVQVVDGDTISVRIQKLPATGVPEQLKVGSTVKVRYIGVDAPEYTAPNGQAATQLNSLLVAGKIVYLELDETPFDSYGRLLAYVYLDSGGYLMVNLMLVSTPFIQARFDSDTPRYHSLFRYFDSVPAPTMPHSGCITWQQARLHVGEELCVTDTVVRVGTSSGGHVFIDLGNPYPNKDRLTIFIPARYVGRFETQFGARFWTKLVGTKITVYGTIKLYKGVPEIELHNPSHLTLSK